MRTVIYCDIDGVLHRWPCSPDEMFDPACIARLENVIQPHDAWVVITSTWRIEWSLEEIREKLGALGEISKSVRTPGWTTPRLLVAISRAKT